MSTREIVVMTEMVPPHFRKRSFLLLPMMAGFVFLVGVCAKSEKPVKIVQVQPAHHQTIRIGLVPEQGVFKQACRYRKLVRYLSVKTGYEITATVFPHYEDIVKLFGEKKLDAAFFGSYTYVLAHDRAGAQIIAHPEWTDGSSAYHGILIVRKDSNIRSVSDLKGKRFAFVDRETTAGYLFPVAFFRSRGVDYRTFFRETYFTGTHADVVHDVLNKLADAGAVKNTVFERLAAKDPRLAEEIVVLERSPDVPENGLAVRADLDATVQERFTAVLLAMHNDPEGIQVLTKFGAQRFIPLSDDDYRAVRTYAATAGIRLRTGRQAAGR